MPKKLILASGSLGRRELMTFHGYEFEVRPSNVPEPTEADDGGIRRYVADLAWRKKVLDGFKVRGQPKEWVAGKFVHPHDAAFDKDGNIFVVEWVSTGRVSFLKKV